MSDTGMKRAREEQDQRAMPPPQRRRLPDSLKRLGNSPAVRSQTLQSSFPPASLRGIKVVPFQEAGIGMIRYAESVESEYAAVYRNLATFEFGKQSVTEVYDLLSRIHTAVQECEDGIARTMQVLSTWMDLYQSIRRTVLKDPGAVPTDPKKRAEEAKKIREYVGELRDECGLKILDRLSEEDEKFLESLYAG